MDVIAAFCGSCVPLQRLLVPMTDRSTMTRMPATRRIQRDRTDFKQVTTLLVVGGVILACIAGITAFALSFRPSRFSLDPGTVLIYQLVTTTTEISGDNREGRPFKDERTIALVGIGPDNEIAMLAEESRGRDVISLHRIDPDGTATLLDAAARPTGGSRAIGLFDLNLLALPPSATEQSWDVQLTYAVMPPAKQLVQARAKRSKSSSNPEFQLKFPALEWLDTANGSQGGYRQIKDLVATYRFRNSQSAVDQVRLQATYAVELPEPATKRRYRVVTTLELIDRDSLDEDPLRLRSAALACAAASDALTDSSIGTERRRALSAELRGAETAVARLRQLTDRLAGEVLRPPVATPQSQIRPTALRYAIQVAVGPEGQKAQAEQYARTLVASGFTARVEPANAGNLRVTVGPFAEKNPEVLERLQRAFPYLKPLWIEVTP